MLASRLDAMFQSFQPICPYCQYSFVISRLRPWHLSTANQQPTRRLAHVQRKTKTPSRMVLSPTVAQRAPTPTRNARPVRRTTDSPFGGMNRIDAGDLVPSQSPRRLRSDAEIKRSSGKQGNSGKKEEKKERVPGDQKALKMQQALGHISYHQRTAVKKQIDERKAFNEFALLKTVQDSIREAKLPLMSGTSSSDIVPTPIQRLAIPALLGQDANSKRRRRSPSDSVEEEVGGMQQFLLAAETGSGKTLAYALPTIDAIKRAEELEKNAESTKEVEQEKHQAESLFSLPSPLLSSEEDRLRVDGRPRAIVLLPTIELVDQVGRLFKAFSHEVKLRVAPISAAFSATVIRNRLYNPNGIDVLISTPHLLSSIAKTDPNVLARVTHLIIDEADSLLDRSFAPLTSDIIDRSSPSLKQLILCSATIPRSLDDYLRRRFPAIRRLATPNLHAIPRRVQLGTVDVEKDPYRGNRLLACADTIWSIGRKPSFDSQEKIERILVFVNERETANEVAQYLRTKGIDAIALNRDTTSSRQSDPLKGFTEPDVVPTPAAASSADAASSPSSPSSSSGPPDPAAQASRKLPNTKVLVLTDIGSRGIDTVPVRNVVLYDVPNTTIDFIHRLGRCGRMNRRGKGVVLLGKDDRKDVVREVRESMFMGKALL